MGGKPTSVLVEIADVFPWIECLLIGLLWVESARRHVAPVWFLPALAASLLLGRGFRYGVELYRNLYPVEYIQYYIPGLVLYCAALVVSWWKNAHGVVHWKGRAYPAGTA